MSDPIYVTYGPDECALYIENGALRIYRLQQTKILIYIVVISAIVFGLMHIFASPVAGCAVWLFWYFIYLPRRVDEVRENKEAPVVAFMCEYIEHMTRVKDRVILFEIILKRRKQSFEARKPSKSTDMDNVLDDIFGKKKVEENPDNIQSKFEREEGIQNHEVKFLKKSDADNIEKAARSMAKDKNRDELGDYLKGIEPGNRKPSSDDIIT